MYKLKPKVFFCYTVRDKRITLSLLSELKRVFNSLNLFASYIDLIDNISNTNPQQNVIKNLSSSDILCIIETPKTYTSPWVKKEINYAQTLNIPIIQIKLNSISHFINLTDKSELVCNSFILEIIQTLLSK